MENAAKKVKYPENLPLKLEVFKSGRTIDSLAEEIGVSRQLLSRIINGHNKGVKQVRELKYILSKNQ